MLKKVKQYIQQHKMITANDLVIIGVSGGPDSMALLHILNSLKQELNFSIVVAHLNHCLREQAFAEEQFVKQKCAAWDIPFYTRTVKIHDLAVRHKRSIEEEGRYCRYQFFSDLKTELGASRIATAHHYDDVAETVLLHLLRGTGIKGLRGIIPVSGSLIRPLLSVNKQQLKVYLDKHRIRYCLDNSNEDTVYVRNRIRHDLIPYLQREFNPRIIDSLNQLAIIAQEENQVLEDETRHIWQDIILKEEKETIIIDRLVLANYLPGHQRRIIKNALCLLAGETEWNMEDINMVMKVCSREGSSRIIHLKKGIRVNKAYNQLIFTGSNPKTDKFSYPVCIPGLVEIKETKETYYFDLIERNQFKQIEGQIYLDYSKLTGPLVLRSRKDGDKFSPQGLNGHKKLKNFFIDQKVPFIERDRIPILASPENIYAVLGYRISELASVDADTTQMVVIKKEKKDNNI